MIGNKHTFAQKVGLGIFALAGTVATWPLATPFYGDRVSSLSPESKYPAAPYILFVQASSAIGKLGLPVPV